MSISELANSLASGANLSLSSPFILKKVTINAHPSCEKIPDDPGVITKGEFYSKPNAYSKLGINQTSIALYENLEVDGTPEINYFNQSAIACSGTVEKYISNGYTPEEAVNIAKAQRSYGINESFYKNGVYTISTSCVDA